MVGEEEELCISEKWKMISSTNFIDNELIMNEDHCLMFMSYLVRNSQIIVQCTPAVRGLIGSERKKCIMSSRNFTQRNYEMKNFR